MEVGAVPLDFARCPLSESSASRLRSINSRETLKSNDTRFSLSLTLTSAEAKERKTSDAILCPFVLILQQAQHKYKRTKKSSGDDPYQERKHLHIF